MLTHLRVLNYALIHVSIGNNNSVRVCVQIIFVNGVWSRPEGMHVCEMFRKKNSL